MTGPLHNLAAEIFEIAEDAGWHDQPTTSIERLCLVHSEASEALEAWRASGTKSWTEVDGKPEGWGPELADVLIRTLELGYMTGVDLDLVVEQKMAYNRKRTDVPTRGHAKTI